MARNKWPLFGKALPETATLKSELGHIFVAYCHLFGPDVKETMSSSVLEQTTTSQTAALPAAGARAMAALRILLGAILLRAFADKALGLGFATPAAKSWVAGGSPTSGYLSSLQGSLAGAFQPLAGNPVVDAAFMLGLLLVGAALFLGVALRAAAVGGSVLMLLMWLSSLPIKTNPVLDEHIIYAAAMIALAAAGAGNTWGFGRRWSELLNAAPAPLRTALA
jgi:thiosulfate dehydrogenase [quinone] large subunit